MQRRKAARLIIILKLSLNYKIDNKKRKSQAANTSFKSFKSSIKWFEFCTSLVTFVDYKAL
jgi:hypothetical protein